MYILITGGCGFIGSNVCVEVLKNTTLSIIIVDNLCNSKYEVVSKINSIINQPQRIIFYKNDIRDPLDSIFSSYPISTIIHCAGLKAVSESIKNPLEYYDANVNGTINLLKYCTKYNCHFIFSSSATVYGNGNNMDSITETKNIGSLPIGNDSFQNSPITNPYGTTKLMIEKILYDTSIAYPKVKVTALRYFNPIGSHESGLLGDDPNGIPNNLMPYIYRVALYNYKSKNNSTCNHLKQSAYKQLQIFGTDYNTPDGTCCRDFIHVVDLANAHVCAMNNTNLTNYNIYNVGTGKATSVKELVDTFIKVNDVEVPYVESDRRPGDVEILCCNSNKIQTELNWHPKYSIDQMCIDVWKQKDS